MILVGDAAGFTSPLFEGGSHLALWSGRQAALTIASVISKEICQTKACRVTLSVEEKFPPYHKILKGKTSLYDLSDKEMSNMARCLPEELGSMSALDKLWIGLKILVRHPFLYTKA